MQENIDENPSYCYQETNWSKVTHFFSGAPWHSTLAPGRGTIAVSNFRYEPGTRICSETPTVTVSGWNPYNNAQIEEIRRKVSDLQKAEKESFFSLQNAFPELSPEVGIFMTNAFDMVDSPNGQESGMYCAIARLNHSCIPNVQQTHYPDTREEVLYASRLINEGDEINDCYIDLRQTRENRRKELLELYRFHCMCEACSMNDVMVIQDDRNRVRAKQLDEFIVSAAEIDPYNALDIAIELISLLESKSCELWSPRYLPDAHYSAYMLAEAIDNTTLMLKHIRLAYNYSVMLQGPDSPDSKKFRSIIQNK